MGARPASLMVSLRILRSVVLTAPLALCASCSGGGAEEISGIVNVDGVPVDAGTISLRPAQGNGPPAGGVIEAGQFTAVSREPLPPGSYTVMVQASKKTGRTFNDPQRGPIEEMQPVPLADAPQQIDLTTENARNLVLNFRTNRP